MASCSAMRAAAQKEGVQKEEGENAQGDGIYLSKLLLSVMGTAFLEVAEQLPSKESSKLIPCFAQLAQTAFAFLNSLYLNP